MLAVGLLQGPLEPVSALLRRDGRLRRGVERWQGRRRCQESLLLRCRLSGRTLLDTRSMHQSKSSIWPGACLACLKKHIIPHIYPLHMDLHDPISDVRL